MFEAIIELVWRCTCSPRLYKLGGQNHASLELHFTTIVERDWMSTWERLMDGSPHQVLILSSSAH